METFERTNSKATSGLANAIRQVSNTLTDNDAKHAAINLFDFVALLAEIDREQGITRTGGT